MRESEILTHTEINERCPDYLLKMLKKNESNTFFRMIEWPIYYYYLFKRIFFHRIIIHLNQNLCHSFIIFPYFHCLIYLIEFIATEFRMQYSQELTSNEWKMYLKYKLQPKICIWNILIFIWSERKSTIIEEQFSINKNDKSLTTKEIGNLI